MKKLGSSRNYWTLALIFLLFVFLTVDVVRNPSSLNIFLSILTVIVLTLLIIIYVQNFVEYQDQRKEIKRLTQDVDQKYIGPSGILNAKNYIAFLKEEIQKYQIENNNLKQAYNILDQAVLLLNGKLELIYYNQPSKRLFKLNESSLCEPLEFVLRDYELKKLIIDGKDKDSFEYEINHERYEVKLFSSGYPVTHRDHIRAMVVFTNIQKTKELTKMKRDFFAHASHELKTPLTAVLGHLELIENQMIDASELPDVIKRIKFQASQMTYLIEDMLTLSQLETVEEEKYASLDLKTELLHVVDQLNELASHKNVLIHVNVDDEIQYPMSKFDAHKLFKNLIENAIKYSKPNQTVVTDLTYLDNQILFQVKDQGIGIDPKYHERIFNRFYRINKGRIEEGTGLGLSIVKHIILKYKGTIQVESKLDEGTSFKILLP